MKTLTQDQLRCMEVIRFLREDESRWCKGTAAKTAEGLHCSHLSRSAQQWCFAGAWAHLRTMALMDVPEAAVIFNLNDNSSSLDDAVARVSRLFDLP